MRTDCHGWWNVPQTHSQGFFDGDEGPTQEVDLLEIDKRGKDYKPLNYRACIRPDNLSV